MSRVKITNAEIADVSAQYPGAGMTGWGTVVELDGKELPHVRSIEVSKITVDDPITVKVELLATDPFVVDLDATVHVSIVAHPGYELVEVVDEISGRKTYSVVPCEVSA